MKEVSTTLIGVAQLNNGLDWEKNFKKAKRVMSRFAKKGVHLVCFQEAFLSGYHGDIFSRDYKELTKYIKELKKHAYKLDICLLLPTIEKIGRNFYSSAYVFNSDKGDSVCYKQGLTPSEKTVMRSKRGKRKFTVNKVSFGILLCREMEDPAYKYINKGSFPDVILWPSYWGWKYKHKWGPLKSSDNGRFKPFYLIEKVKRPMIQINMASTITSKHRVDKYGKSLVVNANNKKVGVGKYGKEDEFIVTYRSGKVFKL